MRTAGILLLILLLAATGGAGLLVYRQHKELTRLQTSAKVLEMRLQAVRESVEKSGRVQDEALETIAANLAEVVEATRRPAVEERQGEPLEAALVLTRATSSTLRSHGALALREFGELRAEKRLLEMAADDPDAGVRRNAFQSLAHLGSTRAKSILFKLLRDTNRQNQLTAAASMRNLVTAADVPELSEIFGELVESPVASSLEHYFLQIFQQLGDARACAPLMTLLEKKKHAHERQRIAEVLLACATPHEAPILATMLKTLGPCPQNVNPRPWQQALQKLALFADPRVSDAVRAQAQNAEHPAVRKEAAKTLLALQDPTAAAVLLALRKVDYLREILDPGLAEGYPGIEKTDKGYALVDEDKMTSLLEEREKRLQEHLEELQQQKENVETLF